MLLNDFFKTENLTIKGFEVEAELIINEKHQIFNGHFPDQPVVPGVCMMQMVKELMELVTGRQTNLSLSLDMKFLAVIDPVKNNRISTKLKYSIDEKDQLQVTASLFKNEVVHFKFKGQFDFL